MRIANNVTAFNVWSNYTKNLSQMQSAMSKLSTGEIANTDDPAGIGISERMKAQINGTNMARQNTDNAVSMMQTADAWLQKINDQLSRMKSLAVEATSGTMAAADQANIETEYKAMQDEITRITSKYTAAGKYNGLYLFRGGNGVASPTGDVIDPTTSITVQIGADVNQKVNLSLANLSVTNTSTIGTVHTYSYATSGANVNKVAGSSHDGVTWASIIDSGSTSVAAKNITGMIDIAINYVANARASMAAQQNRLEQTADGLLTYEDNLRAAESKIRDVDMAQETTQYSKSQVLVNAATSMLTQANNLPNTIVSQLLQG